jgi:SAM-dependent methyltransferase
MHPIRHAKALVRERLTNVVRSEVRAEMRTTATLAAQVVEARQAGASRLASTYDHTKSPSDEFYGDLAERLRGAGVHVQTKQVDVARFSDWAEGHPGLWDCYYGDPATRVEKLLEHFLSEESTRLTAGMAYIDVAAAGGHWVSCLRGAGLNALALDLSYPQGVHGWRIGADAQEIPLPSGSVDAVSAQCAFECFQGGADVGFMREAARLLRLGGRLAIVPLYVEDAHFIATSPYTIVEPGCFDEGAAVVWRDDEYDEPFARHYSPEALVDRLGDALGLFSETRVVHMTNLESLRERWPGSRLYAYFMLECRK